MSFQVVQSAEARIASVTAIRFLLAMGEEVTLQIMVSGEISIAVRALVSLAGRRPGAVPPAVSRLR